jgi:hypothetical protein
MGTLMNLKLGKATAKRDKTIACALICLFTLHSIPVLASQSGATAAAKATTAAAQVAASAASAAKMAEGTQNSQQGQEMQNMAQMAMGAMQIASALLGMMGAAEAGKQSATNGASTAGLGDLGNSTANGTGATASTPTATNNPAGTTGNTDIGSTGASANTVKINPTDLRTGTFGAAMDQIEKNYGIPRDQFAAALAAGTSPQDILSRAPKNAPSADLLGKIASGMAASNAAATQESVSRILAGANGAGAGTGASTGDGSVELGRAAGTPKSASTADADAQLEELMSAGVSPEVKAAMLAKAAQLKSEREKQEVSGWNIFQLVHSRYQKLETMLYGRVDRSNATTTGGLKGF